MPAITPYEEERPWGRFRRFTQNEPCTVKIISVVAGSSLSLQYHGERSEFWHILSGHPKITIGEIVTEAKPGDEFTVPVKAVHQIEAPEGDVEVLEIAFGNFREDDITRLKDNYGRA